MRQKIPGLIHKANVYGGSLEQIPDSKLGRLGVTPGPIFMSGWKKISELMVGGWGEGS